MRQLTPAEEAAAAEVLLARLYTDAEARARFLADPGGVAAAAGLSPAQGEAFARIDRAGLQMAARSYAAKRAGQARPSFLQSLISRLLAWRR